MRHIMRAEIPSSPFHSRKKVGWKRSRERNAQTAPSSLGFPPPFFFWGRGRHLDMAIWLHFPAN